MYYCSYHNEYHWGTCKWCKRPAFRPSKEDKEKALKKAVEKLDIEIGELTRKVRAINGSSE